MHRGNSNNKKVKYVYSLFKKSMEKSENRYGVQFASRKLLFPQPDVKIFVGQNLLHHCVTERYSSTTENVLQMGKEDNVAATGL